MSSKVFLIQSEGLGRGEDRLGGLLMANFLRLLGESKDKPGTMVFWNTGVRLVCEGSISFLRKGYRKDSRRNRPRSSRYRPLWWRIRSFC
jgi:hypothetical protein